MNRMKIGLLLCQCHKRKNIRQQKCNFTIEITTKEHGNFIKFTSHIVWLYTLFSYFNKYRSFPIKYLHKIQSQCQSQRQNAKLIEAARLTQSSRYLYLHISKTHKQTSPNAESLRTTRNALMFSGILVVYVTKTHPNAQSTIFFSFV